jgi:hypothetical protein
MSRANFFIVRLGLLCEKLEERLAFRHRLCYDDSAAQKTAKAIFSPAVEMRQSADFVINCVR